MQLELMPEESSAANLKKFPLDTEATTNEEEEEERNRKKIR